MSITISADDPRSIKALEIAAGAAQWLKVRTVEGEVAFGIPSQCRQKAGRYYVVTATSCDCEDAKRNALSRPRIGSAGYHGDCKHSRAVQLYDELIRAQQQHPKRSRGHLTALPTAYRDPLTCAECGCFLSKHDPACSQWTEPLPPITDEAAARIFDRFLEGLTL